jgi:hypothetical protein
MKVAIDLHGTIDDDPERFKRLLSRYLLHDPWQFREQCRRYLSYDPESVWVMSGPPEEQIRSGLNDLGFEFAVHYTGIYSVVDYLKSMNVDMWQDEKGNWWTRDDIWWRSKSEMCTKYNVDVLLDDKIQYQEYFTLSHRTAFILYKEKGNK